MKRVVREEIRVPHERQTEEHGFRRADNRQLKLANAGDVRRGGEGAAKGGGVVLNG
jgi:hypothetical protein